MSGSFEMLNTSVFVWPNLYLFNAQTAAVQNNTTNNNNNTMISNNDICVQQDIQHLHC